MNIVVCEDNKEDMDSICTHIDKYFNGLHCPVDIITFESGESFLKKMDILKTKDVKIVFTDIYMPGTSGVDVARRIRDVDSDIVIVFTTSSVDHGLDGYAVSAFQYLVKPFGYIEVKNVLDKCKGLFAESIKVIEVISNRMVNRVRLKDILYIEIYNHTCLIHTVSETIKNYLSLDEVTQMLDAQGTHTFLRTHRSFIVNMRYIGAITENDFLLTNGVAIPIRRSNKLEIKQAYMDYLFTLARNKH